jgi:hypothetical protein
MAGKKNKKIKSFCRPTPMTKNNNNNKKNDKISRVLALGVGRTTPTDQKSSIFIFYFLFFCHGGG